MTCQEQTPRWWVASWLQRCVSWSAALCPSALFSGIRGAGRVLKYTGIVFPGSWQADLRDRAKCIPGMSNFRPASLDSVPRKKIYTNFLVTYRAVNCSIFHSATKMFLCIFPQYYLKELSSLQHLTSIFNLCFFSVNLPCIRGGVAWKSIN